MKRCLFAALPFAVAGVLSAQTIAPPATQDNAPPAVAHTAFPSGPASALGASIATLVNAPNVARAHWGIAVTQLDGTPVFGLHDGELFRPASNAKLFTTAAAMAMLGPDMRFTTQVFSEGAIESGTLHGRLLLKGGGDANFAGGYALPYVRPSLRPKGVAARDPLRDFDELAAAVAAKGIRVIAGDIVGDDSHFDDEPFAEGWNIDDMLWGYGAPISALTVHDNQLDATITPAAKPGAPAAITLTPDVPFYRLNPALPADRDAKDLYTRSVLTEDVESRDSLQLWQRAPGSRDLYVEGDVKPGQPAVHEEIAIADPALFAAIALKAALEHHGITVAGKAIAEHHDGGDLMPFQQETHTLSEGSPAARASSFTASPIHCSYTAIATSPAPSQTLLAEHVSPPLGQDIVLTNKISQNLHAEMMLRNIGAAKSCQSGSLARGEQLLRAFWIRAGIDADDFAFFDGSGLSTKDVVTPRAIAAMLAYAATQPWFPAWKSSLPVGGVDGSLASRFGEKSGLAGKVFAKTGTLGETRALSGYLIAKSGQTLIFSVMVDTHLPGSSVDREAMDKIVMAIADAN